MSDRATFTVRIPKRKDIYQAVIDICGYPDDETDAETEYDLKFYDAHGGGFDLVDELSRTHIPFYSEEGGHYAWDHCVTVTVSDGEKSVSLPSNGEGFFPCIPIDLDEGGILSTDMEKGMEFVRVYRQYQRYLLEKDLLPPIKV